MRINIPYTMGILKWLLLLILLAAKAYGLLVFFLIIFLLYSILGDQTFRLVRWYFSRRRK
jgi:hypothetical protein